MPLPPAIPVRLAAFGPALALTGALAAQNGGFLTGLDGFEHFHEPLGQPFYFESPCNDTGLRAVYLAQDFADASVFGGGDLRVYALQARVALTERLAVIATRSGYSVLDSGLVDDEGWNDLGFGLKYVLLADRASDAVVTTGLRYQAENGTRAILQGGVDEFSPFVSAAKGFGQLHLLGSVTLRVPTDADDGNLVGHWDLHVDYSVNPGQRAVFAPLVEVHGVHYLDDGASGLPVGGLDYANLGSQPTESFVAWAGIGARVEIDGRIELGACYEFALTDPEGDLMDTRVTADVLLRF